jgi:hypothetical protein
LYFVLVVDWYKSYTLKKMPPSTARSTSSVGSTASQSRRYRRVAGSSQVDNTLFGDSKGSIRGGAGVISRGSLSMLTSERDGDVVVLSRSELGRIKRSSEVTSREEEQERAAYQEIEKRKALEASRIRKEKMIRMEEERKRNAPKGELEVQMIGTKNKILEDAQRALDEELDDVKHMN